MTDNVQVIATKLTSNSRYVLDQPVSLTKAGPRDNREKNCMPKASMMRPYQWTEFFRKSRKRYGSQGPKRFPAVVDAYNGSAEGVLRLAVRLSFVPSSNTHLPDLLSEAIHWLLFASQDLGQYLLFAVVWTCVSYRVSLPNNYFF